MFNSIRQGFNAAQQYLDPNSHTNLQNRYITDILSGDTFEVNNLTQQTSGLCYAFCTQNNNYNLEEVKSTIKQSLISAINSQAALDKPNCILAKQTYLAYNTPESKTYFKNLARNELQDITDAKKAQKQKEIRPYTKWPIIKQNLTNALAAIECLDITKYVIPPHTISSQEKEYVVPIISLDQHLLTQKITQVKPIVDEIIDFV